jgi:Terpene cyclase DEP1
MKDLVFKITLVAIAIVFTIIFSLVVIPPFIKNPDIIGAFGAGFVNPYSSGYSADVFCCWAILLVWVIYESPKVKYGWLCLLLGFIPGVAVGFALYLLLRMHYLKK